MKTTLMSVKATKKSVDQLMANAQDRGFEVKVVKKGSVDNIYINEELVAEKIESGPATVFIKVNVT